MTRATVIATTLTLLLLGSAACVPMTITPQARYAVRSVHQDGAGGVDGTWLERAITDTSGLAVVELVYCPLVNGLPSVCRTALVWQRGQSRLSGR